MEQAVQGAGVAPVIGEKTDLEVAVRENDTTKFYFIMNFQGEDLALPELFAGSVDLLTGEKLESGRIMKPYDVAVVGIEKK